MDLNLDIEPEDGRSALPMAWIHLLFLAAIALAMTAMTHNLDDIRVPLFYTMGPLLMLAGLGLVAFRRALSPNRRVVTGLIAYGWVLVISTLFSKYSYVGWDQFLWNWSVFGFFVSAMAIGSTRRGGETLMRGIVVLLLVVTLIGFLMYDFTGKGQSFVALVFNQIYPSGKIDEPTHMFRLLATLTSAQREMQSTILSRDFESAFCVFFLPIAMLLAIDPGETRMSTVWRVVGCFASLTAVASIFLCFSRFQYLAGVVCVFAMSVAFFQSGSNRQRIWLSSLLAGMVVIVALLAWLKYADLQSFLSQKYLSIGSLSVMWAGDWKIFCAYPILGSGPGVYRILFPLYRDPGYFDYGISHVTSHGHNHFLDILSETGLLGFAAFVLILAGIVVPLARAAFRQADPRLRGRSTTGLIAVFAILLSISFSPFSRWIIGAVSMWTVLGLVAGWGLQATIAPARQSAHLQTRLSIGFFALGLVLLPLCTMRGIQYFRASLPYAEGLQYMEPAMEAMGNQQSPYKPADIERMLKQSVAEFEKAIQYDPSNPSPYYKLGSVFTSLSTYECSKAEEARDARVEIEKIAQNDVQADAYLNKAKDVYERLSAINPDYAQIHYNLGIVYTMYAQMLERQKADANEIQNYKSRALDEYKRNYNMMMSRNAALVYANALIGAQRGAEALSVMQAASERYPTNPETAEHYMHAALESKDPAAIARATERLKKVKPDSHYLKPEAKAEKH